MKQEFVYGSSTTIVLSSQKGNDPWLATIEATHSTSMEAKIKATAKRGRRRSKHTKRLDCNKQCFWIKKIQYNCQDKNKQEIVRVEAVLEANAKTAILSW